MKQIILFLALLSIVPLADAQEYSCIPPEHKTFFTNGADYLRGMRIDSVKYVGQEKVYYPFKTARITFNHVDEYADTLGGSWWGSMIIEDTLKPIINKRMARQIICSLAKLRMMTPVSICSRHILILNSCVY